jgi:hypothetical protein
LIFASPVTRGRWPAGPEGESPQSMCAPIQI